MYGHRLKRICRTNVSHIARRKSGPIYSYSGGMIVKNIHPNLSFLTLVCLTSVYYSPYQKRAHLQSLVSLQYETRTVYGKIPAPRGYHAAVLADSRLFLIGGFNGLQSFDDVHILELAASAYLPQVTSFAIEALAP